MGNCLVHGRMISFSELDTRVNLNVGRLSLNKNSKSNISEDSRIGLSTVHFGGKDKFGENSGTNLDPTGGPV